MQLWQRMVRRPANRGSSPSVSMMMCRRSRRQRPTGPRIGSVPGRGSGCCCGVGGRVGGRVPCWRVPGRRRCRVASRLRAIGSACCRCGSGGGASEVARWWVARRRSWWVTSRRRGRWVARRGCWVAGRRGCWISRRITSRRRGCWVASWVTSRSRVADRVTSRVARHRRVASRVTTRVTSWVARRCCRVARGIAGPGLRRKASWMHPAAASEARKGTAPRCRYGRCFCRSLLPPPLLRLGCCSPPSARRCNTAFASVQVCPLTPAARCSFPPTPSSSSPCLLSTPSLHLTAALSLSSPPLSSLSHLLLDSLH